MPAMEARQYIIQGRVQGVGFRWYVQRQASALKIDGWVRNRPDGSVEVWAEAPLAVLDNFQSLLQKGPPGSFVRNIEIENLGRSGLYHGFDIKF
ncbi:MAG: hypothetical protein B0D92_07425 [Spirochaeta sp. LUC14_002_19_P3]|nr:MAG: hypothetical protein B0D92_07425 [Spirochaeta sp. LUC14_002_19_P3]